MGPRGQLKAMQKPYLIDEMNYRRFPVYRQAFVTVSEKDTGERDRAGWVQKMEKRLAERILDQDDGFSLLDAAVDAGAGLMDVLIGKNGDPNTEVLSWQPADQANRFCAEKLKLSEMELTDQVKGVARIFGADLVGVAALDERWIYSDDLSKPFVLAEQRFPEESEDAFLIPKSMKRAIVMAFVMDEGRLAKSPAIEADTATSLGYSRMAAATASMARFIQTLGFEAIPCMNDTALSIPLAVDAGLGQMGRHGLLITPEYGSNVRLCKVLTDMPIAADEPIDFGITEFCRNCLLCAQSCPSGSISNGEQTFENREETGNGGVLKWPIRGETCLEFWQENGTSCSNCIVACPFTSGFESIHCLECEQCELRKDTCILQDNTDWRIRHGFLEKGAWGERLAYRRRERKGL